MEMHITPTYIVSIVSSCSYHCLEFFPKQVEQALSDLQFFSGKQLVSASELVAVAVIV